MTEPDEVVERLTAQLNHLVSLESVGVMVKTADLAAVLVRAARIKELEAALRDALPHLETCFRHHVWRNEPMPEPGYLKNIRALLKEADQ